jgi:hypothetical protein
MLHRPELLLVPSSIVRQQRKCMLAQQPAIGLRQHAYRPAACV